MCMYVFCVFYYECFGTLTASPFPALVLYAPKVLSRLSATTSSSSPALDANDGRGKAVDHSSYRRDDGEMVFSELSAQLERAEDGLLAGEHA